MKKFLKRFAKFLLRGIVRVIIKVTYKEIEQVLKEKSLKDTYRKFHHLQSCGNGVTIEGRVFISAPKFVVIGNNVHIGENVNFTTEGGLVIGDNTHISKNVTIYTVEHEFHGNTLPFSSLLIPKPVTIGRNVWIGENTHIFPGVQIGDGAIIYPGSVVMQDVPPFAIAGGAPARVFDFRDKEHYIRLEMNRQYADAEGKPLPKSQVDSFKRSGHAPDFSPFFVVTTGRSGSMTIARVLSQHPQITCLHEPRHQLVFLSANLAYGELGYDYVKSILEATYRNSTYPEGIYGESDHAFWNLIPILAELFQASKFIWLIRDGREVVASGHGRGWFSPEESEDERINRRRYRLNGAKCGAVSEEEWSKMSVFERNCWYWSFVNNQIEKHLNNISKDRWLMVRIEELQKKLTDVFEFLGVTPIPVKVTRWHEASYPVERWTSWEEEKRKIFERWCREGMDRWYPGWRDSNGQWFPIVRTELLHRS